MWDKTNLRREWKPDTIRNIQIHEFCDDILWLFSGSATWADSRSRPGQTVQVFFMCQGILYKVRKKASPPPLWTPSVSMCHSHPLLPPPPWSRPGLYRCSSCAKAFFTRRENIQPPAPKQLIPRHPQTPWNWQVRLYKYSSCFPKAFFTRSETQ